MLRLLAICGMLTISYSFNIYKYNETTYEAMLREQDFSEEDIQLFMKEFRETQEEVDLIKGQPFVRWRHARGYVECEDLKKTCQGEINKRCRGCQKPKPYSLVCLEQDCLPYEEVEDYKDSCGFEARRLPDGSVTWAVVSIDVSNLEKGTSDAFWRLFKYFNKANSQGVRISKTPYVAQMQELVLDPEDESQVQEASLMFDIPPSFQGEQVPTPTDHKVWILKQEAGDLVFFNRVLGGEGSAEFADILRERRILLDVLEREEGIQITNNLVKIFRHVRPGCGNQRIEVAVMRN